MIITLDVLKHLDFLCKNYILIRLDNKLYGVYSAMNSANDFWGSLKKKMQNGGHWDKEIYSWKVLWLQDDRLQIYHSLSAKPQVLFHEIHAEKMELGKSFQVAAIIEKFPPL